MGKINSKKKGNAGELEFAHLLKDAGYEARRGQQFSGGGDSPDVVCDSLPFNIEVKRVERLNLEQAMEQSKRDAASDGKIPIVAHRRNRQEWLVTMQYSEWIKLVQSSLSKTSL